MNSAIEKAWRWVREFFGDFTPLAWVVLCVALMGVGVQYLTTTGGTAIS